MGERTSFPKSDPDLGGGWSVEGITWPSQTSRKN